VFSVFNQFQQNSHLQDLGLCYKNQTEQGQLVGSITVIIIIIGGGGGTGV
jgi:hypothetical protein